MTKKDGATERVQAISDVCHGLRHAEGDATVWLHLCSDAALLQGGPNMRQGGENGRRPGGVEVEEEERPRWAVAGQVQPSRPAPVLALDSLDSLDLLAVGVNHAAHRPHWAGRLASAANQRRHSHPPGLTHPPRARRAKCSSLDARPGAGRPCGAVAPLHCSCACYPCPFAACLALTRTPSFVTVHRPMRRAPPQRWKRPGDGAAPPAQDSQRGLRALASCPTLPSPA